MSPLPYYSSYGFVIKYGEHYMIKSSELNGIICECVEKLKGYRRYLFKYELGGDIIEVGMDAYNIRELTDIEKKQFLRERALKSLDI